MERGFATISLVILLPLLLAFVFGAKTVGDILINTTKTQTECEALAFQHHHDLAKKLSQLMRYNPKAKALKIKQKIAELRLYKALASGNTLAIIMAEERLADIQLKQIALAKEQERILLTAESLVQVHRLKLKRRLSHYSPKIEVNSLAVRPENPSDLAPEYILYPNFSDNQKTTVKLSWSYKHFNFNRNKKTTVFNIKCAATIEEREGYYKPALYSL